MKTSSVFSPKGSLRISGLLEGISFLVLLGIAMPLKYIAGKPQAVEIVGMAHGILFVWYIISVIWAKIELKLSIGTALLAAVASVLPFGTFYADWKIFRKLKNQPAEPENKTGN